jgi:hypothetical protein
MVDNMVPKISPIIELVRKEVESVVAHLIAEIDGLTQRCEELEIELEEGRECVLYNGPGFEYPSEGDQ